MLKPIGTIAGLGLAVASVSWLYRALRRRFVSRRGNLRIIVETSITIKESPERLYRFWRNFENLPHVMSHLDSVRVTAPTRSHWIVKAPAGVRLEWDAEIINDMRSEEHTSELQSHSDLVCRLLLEKKKEKQQRK